MKTITKLVLCSSLAFIACGCGGQEYEKRLQNTVEYYRYLDVQNENLASAWSLQGDVISYRVPLQFESIPPPPATDYDDGGNLLPRKTDLRQPNFIPGMKFAGLQAAWDVQIPLGQKVGNSDEKQMNIPGYLYLVTNRDYFLDDDLILISHEFAKKTLSDLASTLHISLPEEVTWNQLKIPEKPTYTRQKYFDMLSLASEDRVLRSGFQTGVRIYRYDAGEIQTLLILILPRDIENGKKDDGNNLLKRIDMSLETLVVSDQKPRRGSTPGGGGGDSAGGF